MKKAIIVFLSVFLVWILILFSTASESQESELKEFSTPEGIIKMKIDPVNGYSYINTMYGISFTLSNPKRLSLWAKGLEQFPTGRGKTFDKGAPGQRGWKWGTYGIAYIHDSRDVANMYVDIREKVNHTEMEILIDSWHKAYHRNPPIESKKIKEELKLPNGIEGIRIQYLFTTPGRSEGMWQIAYFEIPENKYLVIRTWNYGTSYGDNTKEFMELIKSLQISKVP